MINAAALFLVAALATGSIGVTGTSDISYDTYSVTESEYLVDSMDVRQIGGGWHQDTDTGLSTLKEDYYTHIGDYEEYLFSVNVYRQVLNRDELAELNPTVVYLGVKYGCTYAVLFGEEPSESLYMEGNEPLKEIYDDIMNDYMYNCIEYFRIL